MTTTTCTHCGSERVFSDSKKTVICDLCDTAPKNKLDEFLREMKRFAHQYKEDIEPVETYHDCKYGCSRQVKDGNVCDVCREICSNDF